MWIALARRARPGLSVPAAKALFAVMDRDGDGFISVDEFLYTVDLLKSGVSRVSAAGGGEHPRQNGSNNTSRADAHRGGSNQGHDRGLRGDVEEAAAATTEAEAEAEAEAGWRGRDGAIDEGFVGGEGGGGGGGTRRVHHDERRTVWGGTLAAATATALKNLVVDATRSRLFARWSRAVAGAQCLVLCLRHRGSSPAFDAWAGITLSIQFSFYSLYTSQADYVLLVSKLNFKGIFETSFSYVFNYLNPVAFQSHGSTQLNLHHPTVCMYPAST